ncbi:MAG: MgtC/SapB family protein [Ramlibacter sp.]
MLTDLQPAAGLGTALAVGLLIGLQRGWQDRERPEGGRVAGLRTFALIGLLGGVLGSLHAPAWPLAAGLVGVALLFAVSFGRASSATGTLSITSAVAGLVTFGLGAVAAQGHLVTAVGAAAVVALLLDLKDELHQGMRRIEAAELNAVLQLGVLTAVVLPLLPDAGLGPYEALNPFRLWVAVLLVAALSLGGHVAARWRGARKGLLWSGLLGGLASSTAATLALARTARAQPALAATAAAGAVASSGVMFVRMALVAALLQPLLAASLGLPLLGLAAATFAAAAWLWRGSGAATEAGVAAGGRVFDLPTAIGFGLLLGVVAVLSRAVREWLGEPGLHAVAFLAGLADVDAPLVSSLHLAAQHLVPVPVAMTAIVLAVSANMLVKAGIAWIVGGAAMGRRVAAAFACVLLVAAVASGLRWL